MPTRTDRTLSQNTKQQGNAVRKQVFMLGPLVAHLMKCTNVCALGVISCRRANIEAIDAGEKTAPRSLR